MFRNRQFYPETEKQHPHLPPLPHFPSCPPLFPPRLTPPPAVTSCTLPAGRNISMMCLNLSEDVTEHVTQRLST